jgi:hypothetical protein
MRLNSQDKIAHQRLSALQLAQAVGNVTTACRQCGMTRTQFYTYKHRFELCGLDGLKNQLPIHKSHPQTTAPEIVDRILSLSDQARFGLQIRPDVRTEAAIRQASVNYSGEQLWGLEKSPCDSLSSSSKRSVLARRLLEQNTFSWEATKWQAKP